LTGEKERVRAQALQLGARDVLVKPFTPLDLYKRIEEHLP
jgi:DNA-binding response OmpR family regulator